MKRFSDNFLEVPIMVHNVFDKELMGKQSNEESWLKFLPSELCGYRPAYEESEPDIELVSIEFKNGDTALVCLSPVEFEVLINNFTK